MVPLPCIEDREDMAGPGRDGADALVLADGGANASAPRGTAKAATAPAAAAMRRGRCGCRILLLLYEYDAGWSALPPPTLSADANMARIYLRTYMHRTTRRGIETPSKLLRNCATTY